jgi:spermidine synthase
MLESIQIKIVNDVSVDQLISIYKDAGWWVEGNDDVDPSFINKIVKGSFCFAVAIFEDNIIGMGRAISDGVSDAYIQDVAVLNKYRNNGIGKLLMEEIIKYLKSNNINWIGLISEPNAVNFYEKIGFNKMENFIPFLLKAGQNE